MKKKILSRNSLKYFLFLLCSWLFIIEVRGQLVIDNNKSAADYIINTTEYKDGIYRNFKEFKYNCPSITSGYEITKKGIFITDSKKGKKRNAKKYRIWGVSDSNKVYISGYDSYFPMLETGRYCYFEGYAVRYIPIVVPPIFVLIPYKVKTQYIVNFNTGKNFLLKNRLWKAILKTDDPELYEIYRMDADKKKKMREYVVKYNERNKDKVK